MNLPLALAAAQLMDQKQWSNSSYARLSDFARETLGRSGRWIRNLAFLHEKMLEFPSLGYAVAGVADPSTTDALENVESPGHPTPLSREAAILIARLVGEYDVATMTGIAQNSTVAKLRQALDAGEIPRSSKLPAAPKQESPVLDPLQGIAFPVRVKMFLPKPVLAAFEEALDLHRAISGAEVPVSSFIEALCAEAWATRNVVVQKEELPPHRKGSAGSSAATVSSIDPDPDCCTCCFVMPIGAVRVLGNTPAKRQAQELCERLERARALIESASDADVTPEKRRFLAAFRELIEADEYINQSVGNLLRDLCDSGSLKSLGLKDIGQYAVHVLGISATTAANRLRISRRLTKHGPMSESYASQRIGIEKTLILLQCTQANHKLTSAGLAERAWVTRAEKCTVKRLRDELRHHIQDAGRSRLPLADREWHASLYRQPGRSQARVLKLGEEILASPHWYRTEGMTCWQRLVEQDIGGMFLSTLREITSVLEEEAAIPEAPGTIAAMRPSERLFRFSSTQGSLPQLWMGFLWMIEEFVQTHDPHRQRSTRKFEKIYQRDGYRCAAPGCTSRRNLECHHIHYRSRGGTDHESNLVTLCRFHHQSGEHAGLALCQGVAPLGLTWRLGINDSGAEWFQNEMRISQNPQRAVVKSSQGLA